MTVTFIAAAINASLGVPSSPLVVNKNKQGSGAATAMQPFTLFEGATKKNAGSQQEHDNCFWPIDEGSVDLDLSEDYTPSITSMAMGSLLEESFTDTDTAAGEPDHSSGKGAASDSTADGEEDETAAQLTTEIASLEAFSNSFSWLADCSSTTHLFSPEHLTMAQRVVSPETHDDFAILDEEKEETSEEDEEEEDDEYEEIEDCKTAETVPEFPAADFPKQKGIIALKNVKPVDVVGGRGGHNQSRQQGNQWFLSQRLKYQPAYKNAAKSEKRKYSEALVRDVHERGGRFLQKVNPSLALSKGTTFFEIDDNTARKKAAQALRETNGSKGRATKQKRKR